MKKWKKDEKNVREKEKKWVVFGKLMREEVEKLMREMKKTIEKQKEEEREEKEEERKRFGSEPVPHDLVDPIKINISYESHSLIPLSPTSHLQSSPSTPQRPKCVSEESPNHNQKENVCPHPPPQVLHLQPRHSSTYVCRGFESVNVCVRVCVWVSIIGCLSFSFSIISKPIYRQKYILFFILFFPSFQDQIPSFCSFIS